MADDRLRGAHKMVTAQSPDALFARANDAVTRLAELAEDLKVTRMQIRKIEDQIATHEMTVLLPQAAATADGGSQAAIDRRLKELRQTEDVSKKLHTKLRVERGQADGLEAEADGLRHTVRLLTARLEQLAATFNLYAQATANDTMKEQLT